MSNDVTNYAAEGYDAARAGEVKCPYINTSDASNAWHAGREWFRWDEPRPTPDMKPRESKARIAFKVGRGDIITVRGYGDMLLRVLRRKADNSFVEVRT